MATKYLLQNLQGETLKETSKKQSAIAAAEKDSLLAYQVVTSTGTVVHSVDNRPAPKPEPTKTEKFAASVAHRDFHGNYSIAMAPFSQTIAEAYGGIETDIENLPNSLTRRVHFNGSEPAVKAFLKVLDPLAVQVIEDLRVWQKANIAKRRGLTDMQKYVQHREFILKAGKKMAKEVQHA